MQLQVLQNISYKFRLHLGYIYALAQVKTAKGFGVDNISSFFLKLALPFFENSLTLSFIASIETSTFPESWKIARATPIFKGGDQIDKSNYRPISVLPVIARLFAVTIICSKSVVPTCGR